MTIKETIKEVKVPITYKYNDTNLKIYNLTDLQVIKTININDINNKNIKITTSDRTNK